MSRNSAIPKSLLGESSVPIDDEWLDLESIAVNRSRHLRGWSLKLDRCRHLLKTFPPGQVFLRLKKRLRSRLGMRYQPGNEQAAIRTNLASFQKLFETTSPAHEQPFAATQNGEFTFLNQTVALGRPSGWHPKLEANSTSLLWRFHLHYQEFLLPVAKGCKETHRNPGDDFIFEFIEQWIEAFPPTESRSHVDAWHPYCISRRIPVWLQLFARFPNRATNKLQKNLFDQADVLANGLELDLRGNHLIENYFALGLASCYFEGSEADGWARLAQRGLTKELAAQILDSGEHYEKSPMYHCVVLGNLIRLQLVTANVRPELEKIAESCVSTMLTFLSSILCPDGEIPLLADSCFDEAPSVAQLNKWCQLVNLEIPASPNNTSATGGYWHFRRDKLESLLFDAGQVGAHDLPGHAHADLLNLVGSLDGQRFIIDSGNSSYDDDAARKYSRSSVAHNVMTVDGLDHCDVWSNFRMGFRGQPVAFASGQKKAWDYARCGMDAYKNLGVPILHRLVAANREQTCWVCADWVDLECKKGLNFEGFLHFAPSIKIDQNDNRIIASNDSSSYEIGFFGVENIRLAKSWLGLGFGHRVQNLAAMYSGSSTNSRLIGWYLAPMESEVKIHADWRDQAPVIRLELNQEETELDFNHL